MNRRDFLKLTGLDIAAPTLPAEEPRPIKPIDWNGHLPDGHLPGPLWIASFDGDGHFTSIWPKEMTP